MFIADKRPQDKIKTKGSFIWDHLKLYLNVDGQFFGRFVRRVFFSALTLFKLRLTATPNCGLKTIYNFEEHIHCNLNLKIS